MNYNVNSMLEMLPANFGVLGQKAELQLEKSTVDQMLVLIATAVQIQEGTSYITTNRYHTMSVSWSSMHDVFRLMQETSRRESAILRPVWLGEAWAGSLNPSEDEISEVLCKQLAEQVRRYKSDLYVSDFRGEGFPPHMYQRVDLYRDWFNMAYRDSKHLYRLVRAFAAGETIKPVSEELDLSTEISFDNEVKLIQRFRCNTTDVLTKREIENVYALLKANPEPSRPVRALTALEVAVESTKLMQQQSQINAMLLSRLGKKDGIPDNNLS